MKKPLPILLLLLCAAGFAFGLFELFKLRFDVGDVYPEYSSLRSDPLGTMALCESLEQMPGLTVRRDFSQNNQLPAGKATTYLHLAARPYQWESLPEELLKEIDSFLAGGGRLVVTFFPETSGWGRAFSATPTTTVTNTPARKPVAGKKATPAPARPVKKKQRLPGNDDEVLVSLQEKWGVEFEFAKLAPSTSGIYEPAEAENQTGLPLPETVRWHSGLVFTNLDQSWQTIYARGTNPVVVERRFGLGSVVMATDSYFLSNEALQKERHAALLAWLVGPSRRVVFDEAHLGIVESPSVATLMRKYRLQWVVAGLVVLAGLFIWKNATSFAPPHPEEARREYVMGKDAAEAFVNLLRRNVPARDVLNLCFEEWVKSLGQGNPHMLARVDRAQAVIERETALPLPLRDPARAYREICEILKVTGR